METWILPAALGIGLAAASGLKTFLPLLALSLAARFQLFGIELNDTFVWVASTPALVALSIATVLRLRRTRFRCWTMRCRRSAP